MALAFSHVQTVPSNEGGVGHSIPASRPMAMKHPWIQRLVAIVAIVCLWAGSALAAPPPAGFRPEVKFAQVGDIRMAYYTRGQGEPLRNTSCSCSTTVAPGFPPTRRRITPRPSRWPTTRPGWPGAWVIRK
jgi:hypothetical protein